MNERLKAARMKNGWSQEDAADAAQISPRTYQRWESGETHPNFESRRLLRKAFGATDEELGLLFPGIAVAAMSEVTRLDLSPDELVALCELIRAGSTMALFDPAKRKTLEKLAMTLGITVTGPHLLDPEPWERLALITVKPGTINDTTIQHFDSLLRTCRALSNGSELDVAARLLGTILPRLHEAALYQPAVAGLAAQAIQLQSILIAHNLHIDSKITLCQAAIEYAKLSSDPNLIASGLLQLSVAYHYAQKPEKALKTHQEALYYIGQVSPLVQSHIYTESAATLAQFARKKEAECYIDLAHEAFPAYPEQDPCFVFEDHGSYNLALYHGIMRLHLQQPHAAWDAFEPSKRSPNIPERFRLEIRNHQGRAAVMRNDLDQYVACLEDGLAGAVVIQSKKRFDEAVTIFRTLPSAWYREVQIQRIVEQYSLPTG
ncbi:MAG: helix-turn-helix transcriptional regulator [Ktedonobacteraceae bacterium]|nr:helix-turn-helix transcriptional regulator [Ktedonobacteraceae bacterium]